MASVGRGILRTSLRASNAVRPKAIAHISRASVSSNVPAPMTPILTENAMQREYLIHFKFAKRACTDPFHSYWTLCMPPLAPSRSCDRTMLPSVPSPPPPPLPPRSTNIAPHSPKPSSHPPPPPSSSSPANCPPSRPASSSPPTSKPRPRPASMPYPQSSRPRGLVCRKS
jgi:hypothetical protein